ncbi:MAG: hypothetical protein R3B95_08310 [Nitrospirales bacterium]|nr:hypothetical protein [Nitrospirales bacterium]
MWCATVDGKVFDTTALPGDTGGKPITSPLSNHGYAPVIMLESFLLVVWVGGMRFTHIALVRCNTTLGEIFG